MVLVQVAGLKPAASRSQRKYYKNAIKSELFGVVIAYYLAVFCGKGECKNEIVNLIVVK